MKTFVTSALVLAALAAFTWWRWAVTTDLEYFLPQGKDTVDADVLRGLTQSPISRRVVFVVTAKDSADVVPATSDLQAALVGLPLTLTSQQRMGEALMTTLFPYRYHLASAQPERDLPAQISEAGLDGAAQRLKEALSSPAGSLVRGLATRDPLLLSRRMIDRIAALDRVGLQMREGVLVTPDGRHGVVFAASTIGAFDGPAQTRLWDELERIFERVRRKHGGVQIEASALARHAVAAERSMRADVTRVSVISTVAVLLGLWLVFGRLRYVPWLMVPLAVAFLAGTFACLAVFGRIHAMTFAFGSSLIGVCADYPIHLVNHLALHSSARAHWRRQVLPALLLGWATTVAGLGAMAWGGLPGLKEIALFGAAGVTAGMLATVLWLPTVFNQPATARHRRIAEWCGYVLRRALAARTAATCVLIGSAGICLVGLPRVRWQDDPQRLTTTDPALHAQDIRVRAASIGAGNEADLVVVICGDAQSCLARNDALASVLDEGIKQGVLEAASSVHNLLWSTELQRRNVIAWKRMGPQALQAALTRHDFDAEAFTPFGADGGDLNRAPVRLSDLPKDVYEAFVAPWRITLPSGRMGWITRLGGVKDRNALGRLVKRVPEAHHLDVGAFRLAAYGKFRERTIMLLGYGAALVALALWLRYRNLRLAICAFGPALAASGVAMAVLALIGHELNLMHAMGLLLVLSMGADYGIFIVESLQDGAALEAPALSVTMACLSTVLSFGLLALSSSPALRAVGEIIGLGVVSAWVFSAVFAAVFKPAV